MARFYGNVGFSIPQETDFGIYTDKIEARKYFGDVLQHTRKWQKSEAGVNDDLSLENRISIVADDYAIKHCSAIKYVEWMHTLWKVTSMRIESPRIILSFGGVWNGKTDRPAC